MAAVLGAFVPDTAVRWRGLVTGEVARRMGVTEEAKRLAARLERVGDAVEDAEARAARGDEAAARWLANVRAVAYEADGAVDRCRVAARRLKAQEQNKQQQQQKHHHHQPLPRLLLSSCFEADEPIAADIKNLNRKLIVILKEKHKLQLRSSFGDHHHSPVRAVPRHQESQQGRTRAPNSDFVGARIEDDAHQLVRQLAERDGQTSCTIVAIVGPDGIGKTTLAAKVYRSERIRRIMEARSWVRITRGHNEASLLSQVIDSFGGYTMGGESLVDLRRTLSRLVEKKRCLLVLDDVCYGGVWTDVLRSPMERAGRGSKVLVTARHGSIAREMGASHVHRVKKLGTDDGWLLLRSAASVADETVPSVLNGVGESIVEKCGGLPLAIKVVAGVLRTRSASADKWAEVLKSPAWSVKGLPEDAMKPLYLCYDDLPCHLKQCFLYCSMFPSDLGVDRHVLVRQWISEGFVQIRADAGVEEMAEEYYDELVGRHLLQTAEEDENGGATRCIMHDTVRALAQLLSQGEVLTGDPNRQFVDGDLRSMPRHVSFPERSLTATPQKILKYEGLRTLLLQRNPLAIEGTIFTRLQHLRVLDLSETAVDLVPENLGNLVYLRYLNLSDTRIQDIPESIGNLWNLKFLLLRGCKSLHKLPKGIEHLRGLRDLDLAGTVIDDAAFRVGYLRSLTSLQCFAVTSKEARAAQDRHGWPLDELKQLSQLRILHIMNLENATGRSEAAEMALADKKNLRELEMSCSKTARMFQTTEGVRHIDDIFEEVNPPQCLESLKIANYFGSKFPIWLSPTFLPNLRHLNIIGCDFCQSFPPLGQLPELRSLYIADSSALKDIGTEFMGTDHQVLPFPKLENLHLQGLQKLKKWTDIEVGAFPSLQALQLESCPELQHLPAGLRQLTSLTELRIVDMASLEAVEDIPSLTELSVWNAPKLKCISNMPSLEDFNMCHCPELQMVNIDGLQTVHISDHELRAMPRWIETLASRLQSLNFTSTVALLKRCLVDGPDWPVIKDIKQVNGYSTGSNYIYYTRCPYIFESDVNIDVEQKSEDPDDVDQCSVSSSDTGYQEIQGFFDSKVVNTRTTKSKGNVKSNMEDFIPRPTHRRLHKLAEVPEEDEVEEGVHSALHFPSNTTRVTPAMKKVRPVFTDDHAKSNDLSSWSKATQATDDDGTNNGTISTNRRGSKAGKGAPDDDGTSAYPSAIKTTASISHKLVREGSQAVNITEIDQYLKSSTNRIKEHISKKGQATSFDVKISKDISPAHSRQVTSKRGKVTFADTTTATVCSSNIVTQNHIKSQNATSPKESANGTPTSENPSDKDVSTVSAGVSTSSVIHETSQTVLVTETNRDLDSSLLRSNEQAFNNEGEEVAETICATSAVSNSVDQEEDVEVTETICASSAISNSDDHEEDVEVRETIGATSAVSNSVTQKEDIYISSLIHEESKEIGAMESSCDSGPCKSSVSLVRSNQQQTQKTLETISTQASGDTDGTMKKILGMASRISEKLSNECEVGTVKDPLAETGMKVARPASKPTRTVPRAIDITEAGLKPESTTASRFLTNAAAALNDGRTNEDEDDDTLGSIDAEANDDDPHQAAPKVYTAIWADTDTDTLRARFVESMRRYRRMASRRRRRRERKHGSGSRWSVGPAAVAAALLLVSVAQLLFIIWMYRRLTSRN